MFTLTELMKCTQCALSVSPVGWVFSSWRSLACDRWRVGRALGAPLLCDCPGLSSLALRSSYTPTRTESPRPTAAPDHPDSTHNSVSSRTSQSIKNKHKHRSPWSGSSWCSRTEVWRVPSDTPAPSQKTKQIWLTLFTAK